MPLSLAWHGRDDAGRRKTPPLRRFLRAKSGATAVEFALISPVFLGLLFGILEVALTFWSTQVLETAVANAAREIYTGSFTQGTEPTPLGAFKKKVCGNVKALFNCDGLIRVDIRKVDKFSEATVTVPIRNRVFDTSDFRYDAPAANSIFVVRAAMEYPVYVNLFGYQTGLASGNRLIMASAVFRTEPF